jgi:AhpD family alkylhydroperoxidase
LNATSEHTRRRGARFWKDFAFILLPPTRLLGLLFGIDRALRERVMLAVSEVNGCRWCSYIHAREALRAGITQSEIDGLLAAAYDHVPKEHLTAVLFAQHWADSQGEVETEAMVRLEESYDARTVRNILLSIRFINTMNWMMQGLEEALHALTFGTIGKKGAH